MNPTSSAALRESAAPGCSRRRFVLRLTAGSGTGLLALAGLAGVRPAHAQQSSPAASPAAARAVQTATVRQIRLHIWTGDLPGAETDGDVFLGLGGREFFVDSADNDFERGTDKVYVFGEGANVRRPAENDPRRQLPLDPRELTKFPIYLRLAGGSDWNVQRVDLQVIGPEIGTANFGRLASGPSLWLGAKKGLFLYLR